MPEWDAPDFHPGWIANMQATGIEPDAGDFCARIKPVPIFLSALSPKKNPALSPERD
jgi:hypothetical protein